MIQDSLQGIDITLLLLMFFLALMLFYQAFINLIKKRYTKIGFDALIVFLDITLAGKKSKYVRKHIQEPERVHRMGIFTFLFACGVAWGAIQYWAEFIQPYLK